MAAGLVVSGLKKRYGGNWALSGVDLHVEPGELRAVIGPNGAGKSTLFGTIAGEHTPTEGTIFLDGEDLTPLSAHAKARRGIARTFQVTRNFTEMTALENVQVAVLIAMGQSRRMWRPVGPDVRSRAKGQALASVNMLGQAHVIAGELSQGDRKRLEIAGALARRSPARRAHGRHVAGGDRAHRRPDRGAVAPGRHHDPAHRTRHRHGVPAGRPHHGPRPGAAAVHRGRGGSPADYARTCARSTSEWSRRC